MTFGLSDHAHPKRDGLIERTITRLFMRPARVAAATTLSPDFRLIDFQGDALRACAWTPGDKIQVKFDGGLITRTYTPIGWDKAASTARILAYCHGCGPGSEWARTVTIGDKRQILGPRRSLELGSLTPSTVVFGDETSFGLAAALLASAGANRGLHFVFEVNALAESRRILSAIGVPRSTVLQRSPNGSHLAEISQAILHLSELATIFVLSGNAQSIQYVNRVLKDYGVERQQLKTKAFWAPGKTGLD